MIRFGTDAVASGTFVHSITHNLSNSGYVTALVPNWNTIAWVGSRSANAVTVYFSTQVGSDASKIDWRVEA